MEAVDVLCGIDGFENPLGIDLLGKRKLNEDAVDVVVGIEISDELQHVIGGGITRRSVHPAGHVELFASGDFAFDIQLGSGIVTDQDSGEAGADILRLQAGDFVFQLKENLIADFRAIENLCGHGKRIA